MASLRIHLSLFWLALVAICVWLGLLFYVVYDDSAGAQIARVRAQTEASCASIAGRYRRSAGSVADDGARTELLQVILQLVLVEQPRVEGGIWSPTRGHLVYAYPTYEGTGLKRDVPEAERGHIESVATESLGAGQPRTDVARTSGEALVVSACPLGAPSDRLAAWTMGRTSVAALDAQRNLQRALGVIGGLVLLSGAWFTAILLRAARHVRDVVAHMNDDGTAQDWTTPSTGVRELDTMLAAFGQHRARLLQAEASLRAVQHTRARDQRLASLGRMTAGIAHEIRNPIAAMRLRAENALAGSPDRQADGLRAVLGEIVRLDGLVKSLMALVQPLELGIVEFDLKPWLQERVQAARQKGGVTRRVDIALACDGAVVRGDPLHLARALDNLLDNAIRHAAARVQVDARVDAAGRSAVVRVVDDGPGVAPEMAERLFEPFATGRTDGHGLGLALAQEVAIAHGGQVEHGRTADGATEFKLEWTWRA
jgi:signal transduction histidine kinase